MNFPQLALLGEGGEWDGGREQLAGQLGLTARTSADQTIYDQFRTEDF